LNNSSLTTQASRPQPPGRQAVASSSVVNRKGRPPCEDVGDFTTIGSMVSASLRPTRHTAWWQWQLDQPPLHLERRYRSPDRLRRRSPASPGRALAPASAQAATPGAFRPARSSATDNRSVLPVRSPVETHPDARGASARSHTAQLTTRHVAAKGATGPLRPRPGDARGDRRDRGSAALCGTPRCNTTWPTGNGRKARAHFEAAVDARRLGRL
jgi:hypothetical protein